MIVTTVSRMLQGRSSATQAASPQPPPAGPMEAEPETKVLDRESATKDKPALVPASLGVGTTVGRYELIHRLGHGGMAAVYLGRATGRAGFEKLVAVKVIHPHLAAEPEFVEMFLDEARIAGGLHHPHVVEIHDLGDADGVFFMVMEYVEGETLASLLRQLRKQGERLPLSAVLQVVADACEGLAAAHDLTHVDGRPMHLVHRDVSPHNLLVSMDGRVKVVDFGIAKATGRRSSTRTGQLRGKLAYMSPEQAGGGSIDHRTDLFALGAVLWELLAGERLFTAETESETLARVTACEVPDIRERSDVPAGVAALVTRALARKPEARFATAQDMLREVRAQLRALDGDVDPRADLAAVMRRLFEARVGYIRAAVRRAGESGTHRERAANDPVALDDATKHGERPAERSSGSGPIPALRASGSLPVVPVPGTHTHTLTASLASAPARHWSLWLLLPLVGALVGSAVVSRWFGPKEPEAARIDALQQPSPRPTLASAGDAAGGVGAVASATVKWRFDTEPDGAIVKLDGKPYPQLTPVTIEMSYSVDPVEVVISREGYIDQELRPAPLGNDNFNIQFKPVAEPSEPVEGDLKGRRKPGVWMTARTKKSPDGKVEQPATDDAGAAGDDSATRTGEPGDGRTLPPRPNYELIKGAGKPNP
jgi:serine/threonine protein kinase